jgi:hypothetical protein
MQLSIFEKSGIDINSIADKVQEFMNNLGYSARISNELNNVQIEPDTRKTGANRSDYFDGLQIWYFENAKMWEVSEYMAGKKEDQLWIYKNCKTLHEALNELIKGNKRKPIKIYK